MARPASLSRPWRLGRLAICLAVAQLAAACASTPEEPQGRKGALPESYYVIAPWSKQPPVNITARLNAVNAALAGVQHSIDSYYAGLKAQADAHNSRVFMRAELARTQAEEQKREEARRAAQAKAQAQAGSGGVRFKTAKIGYIAPSVYDSTGLKFGFQLMDEVHGWNRWSGQTILDSQKGLDDPLPAYPEEEEMR